MKYYRFLISAVLLMLVSCGKDGEVKNIPGCKCEMLVPDGFKEVAAISGFQHETNGAAIKVTQQKGAFFGLSQAIDADVLKASGMKLLKKENVAGSDQKTYFYLSQQSGGVTYLQHMLLVGDNDKTYIVNAIVPESLGADYSEELKKSVLSVSCKDLKHLENAPPVGDTN